MDITIQSIYENNSSVALKKDSSFYFGGITNNMRWGVGIIFFKNGNTYEGEWVKNAKHGKGVEVVSNE